MCHQNQNNDHYMDLLGKSTLPSIVNKLKQAALKYKMHNTLGGFAATQLQMWLQV